MVSIPVTLAHGLKIGEVLVKNIEIGELTVKDLIDAGTEAERVIEGGGQFRLATSPAMAGMHMLRRQVKSVGQGQGAIPGPLTLEQLLSLDTEDFFTLQQAAARLDQAVYGVVEEATTRGRGDPAP